ncbi:hypothetical protein KAH94_00625, partial [bacterium]|nr:hypothetical protein [bacterium]
IKYFINNEQIANILQNTFASTILAENVMLSFWRVDNFKHASKKFYFNFPGSSWLNKYRNLLLIKSITAHQKRIGWIISAGLATGTLLTYSMLKACNINISEKLELWAKHYKSGVGQVLFSLLSFKKLQPVKQYINKITNNRLFACISAAGIGTTCALGIPESLRWSNQCFTIEDCVHKIMVQAAQFVKTMRTAYETIKADKTLSNYKEFKDLIIFFEEKVPQSQKLQELLKLLSYDTFGEKPSYFSHKGNILRTFRLMHEVKFEFKNALISIGAIDKWLSIAKLYKEFEHTNTPFCFTEYKKLEKPCIDLKMFWHPLIDTKKAIHNSITLGINNERQNIIVTGPNAGGKSTTLKAIALNIILSQTFGITSAKNATLTPFSLISTYLNITDDLGTGNSLFKAEVKRTDELLQAIEQLQPEQHKFVMFDEIFNGTSPLEGTASAYSVAKYISSQQNTICLVATHFKLLTELENTTDSFTNYKVSVEHQENGKIFYPYKIENGISDQHVAIDILRNEGFNSCILNEAQAIVKKLSTTNNEKQTSLQLK